MKIEIELHRIDKPLNLDCPISRRVVDPAEASDLIAQYMERMPIGTRLQIRKLTDCEFCRLYHGVMMCRVCGKTMCATCNPGYEKTCPEHREGQ